MTGGCGVGHHLQGTISRVSGLPGSLICVESAAVIGIICGHTSPTSTSITASGLDALIKQLAMHFKSRGKVVMLGGPEAMHAAPSRREYVDVVVPVSSSRSQKSCLAISSPAAGGVEEAHVPVS